MKEFEERKVLRSFYIPEALDERLRTVAFRRNVTKGELVRNLLLEGLDGFRTPYRRSASDRPQSKYELWINSFEHSSDSLAAYHHSWDEAYAEMVEVNKGTEHFAYVREIANGAITIEGLDPGAPSYSSLES